MLHLIRQVLDGTKEIDEKLKYQVIGAMIGLVHTVLLICFFLCDIKIPAYYNIFVVLYYLIVLFAIGKMKSMKLIFVATFLEILFHSVMVTLFLGWDASFMSYTIGLIPMAFYMIYTVPELQGKYMVPATVSVIIFLVYFGTWQLMTGRTPIYQDQVSPQIIDYFDLGNTIMMFMFLITASLLFAMEMGYMQHHLQMENVSLNRMANFDALTHLLNRRSMNIWLKDALDEAQAGGAGFCILMSDIDDFKKVNDKYGHAKGDEVLVEVARVLQSNVREQDRVCRWGGEEMLIMLRSDMEIARSVAQRICHDMEETMIEDPKGQIQVTLTIGVSEYQEGESIRSLIETADERMYRGKRSGKNCVVWN